MQRPSDASVGYAEISADAEEFFQPSRPSELITKHLVNVA
jgi:hypothetical protein